MLANVPMQMLLEYSCWNFFTLARCRGALSAILNPNCHLWGVPETHRSQLASGASSNARPEQRRHRLFTEG